MAVIIRLWTENDQEGVMNVLREAAFTNVWPGFVLTLNRQWYKMLLVALSVLALAITKSPIVYISTVLIIMLSTYAAHLISACVYYYGPILLDMKDVSTNYMEPKDCNFWVAEDTDTNDIAGTIAIVKKDSSKDLKVAWLRRMAVSARHRNQGIAKQLVAETINFCKKQKFHKIELITTEVHHAARNLYLKLGFICRCFRPYIYFKGLVHIWTYEYEYILANNTDK